MKQKLHIFFRRVSSANQDLATQIEFDRLFREKCDEDQILIVNEDATSANKLRLNQRPKIMEVLELIEADKVDTVYAYDRTRLFRDYYEAQDFCHACIEHEVNIIFTSTSNGHVPFTGDILMEGILNLFGDIEGKNIARRTLEARRKYPPKKFGYNKLKDNRYEKSNETKAMIEEFFEEIKQIDSIDKLIPFLSKYRKAFAKSRTDENLFKMATDPFYAGYDLHDGEYELPHVEPFLSKESFLQIQGQIVPIMEAYEKHISKVQAMYTNVPKCGHCLKTLKPRLTSDRSAAFVSCSNGHNKVHYKIETINTAVKTINTEVIKKLDADKLLDASKKKMKEIENILKQEMGKTKNKIAQVSDVILFLQDDTYDDKWDEVEQYKHLHGLFTIYQHYENVLDEKKEMLAENQKLYQLTLDTLQQRADQNIKEIADLLINEVRLFEDKIEVDINKFDYINGMNTEIILKEENVV